MKEFSPTRLYGLYGSSSLAFLSSDLRTAVFQSDCRLVGVIAAPLFFSFAVILLEIRCSAVT